MLRDYICQINKIDALTQGNYSVYNQLLYSDESEAEITKAVNVTIHNYLEQNLDKINGKKIRACLLEDYFKETKL